MRESTVHQYNHLRDAIESREKSSHVFEGNLKWQSSQYHHASLLHQVGATRESRGVGEFIKLPKGMLVVLNSIIFDCRDLLWRNIQLDIVADNLLRLKYMTCMTWDHK